jgi:hypothetical protein
MTVFDVYGVPQGRRILSNNFLPFEHEIKNLHNMLFEIVNR